MKTGCFVCTRECGGVCGRNCNADFAFVSLGNRCTLIFELWSHFRPTAEGRVSTYTLVISGMVTIRYFIYDKVLRNAFLLFETCFFCYYRTVFIFCRPNPLLQLHVKGTSHPITDVGILGHCNWWFE